jgi:hypothetical protein
MTIMGARHVELCVQFQCVGSYGMLLWCLLKAGGRAYCCAAALGQSVRRHHFAFSLAAA